MWQKLFLAALAIGAWFVSTSVNAQQRYNEIFRVASHNSYSRDVATSLTSVLPFTTSIELDIHPNSDRGTFDVYHILKNPNNCAPDKGDYDYAMTVCLKALKTWGDQHVGQVFTIFLDLKSGGWKKNAGPTQLDARITSVIPEASIYKPSDLRAGYSSLRQAAGQGAWPTMTELTANKNTYIFVLTGENNDQSEYVTQGRLAFAAPSVTTVQNIVGVPSGFNSVTSGAVVFYNIHDTDLANGNLTQTAFARGYISRVWSLSKSRENSMQVSLMAALQVQFAAFYDYKLKPPPKNQLKVIAYEDDNGWNGAGEVWYVAPGSYSYKGRGGNLPLPFPNDEIRSVYVPAGLRCYMTDEDSFKTGDRGTETINGPSVENIKNGKGLAGKVSSMRVTVVP